MTTVSLVPCASHSFVGWLSLSALLTACVADVSTGPSPSVADDARPRPGTNLTPGQTAAEVPIAIDHVQLGGLTFDVRRAGPPRGDVVVLLHGFPESSYEWRYQLVALAEAGYRVLAPDLRGTGADASPPDVEAYGLLNYVFDVLGLVDTYGVDRFHLVGHDVGAIVAWGTAQFFGLRLKSLTAVSVPHPGAFAAQLADPDSCQSRASAWYQDVMEPGAPERYLAGDPPLLVDVWASMEPDAEAEYRALLGTPEALGRMINLWRANFIDGQPQGALPIPVLVPTLYVWGEQDVFNCGDGEPLTRALTWAAYRFVSLPEVGHFVPEEAPDRFNRLLLRHLGRHRR